MNESIIRKLNKEKHLKKKRNAVVILLCALVAFGTSYATGGRGPLICILSGLLTALSAAFLLGRKYQN